MALILYHALRTSTCQNQDVWLDSNQRPVLIHTFTVSFTIIVSTDLPLNYTQSKMVGAVGLAPTKAFRPGDLQSPAIAAMRCSQKNGSRGRARTFNISVNSRTLYHWATLELKWLPRKDSHLHKNVNSVPCYFDTTRELKNVYWISTNVPPTNYNLVRL